MKYLKDEQYYIDRYDLHTIEECLDAVKMFQEVYEKSLTTDELKYLSEEEKLRNVNLMLGRYLFVIKGKRYEKKLQTIQKWMEVDKVQQDKQDHTPIPEKIFCPFCNTLMYFNITKHLESTGECPILRMMFLFKCYKCEKQQWVYEDGELRVSKPELCHKCTKELSVTFSKKKKLIITKYKCNGCGYMRKDEYDLAKSDEEHKKWEEDQIKKEEAEKKLLEKYRLEFCLTDKQGKEYIETIEAMEVAAIVREEEKQKYDNPIYERSLQLKKTSISDLEKILNKNLEKSKYSKLSFDKPEIGQHVSVPFTVQDEDSSRNERVSSSELEKLIKTVLENTNWRLLSNSVMYRLGYLKGQLKGYEREEDTLKLVGKKEEPNPKSKIDDAKRQKYASNNLVQLARLLGEHDGIEATRKRRLEKEPDGFILNDGKVGYTCGVCYESISGNNTWWDLKGIRCLDCQRNLKEGVVPLEIFEDDYGYDVLVKGWQLKSNYGIHPATVRKLHRDGTLKGRDLKRKDGTVYETLYLISENKDFFDKHPKLDSKIKMTISDKDEKSIEL